MKRLLDQVALFCLGALVFFQVSCAQENLYSVEPNPHLAEPVMPLATPSPRSTVPRLRSVGPKVLFRVTVPSDPLEETYLDPMAILQNNKLQSPSAFPSLKKDFLTQNKSYTLFQDGRMMGTVHPHRFVMQECNGEELVTGKPQFSTASYERDHESKEASFLASNQQVTVNVKMDVTEKEKEQLRQAGLQQYQQDGFSQPALDRLKVTKIVKKDIFNNKTPLLIATIEIHAEPGSMASSTDKAYGALLMIAHQQDEHLITDFVTSPTQAETEELYRLLDTDDVDGDGIPELIFQKSYGGDAGYTFEIMKWAQGKWTVIYTGGGSGGC